MLGCACIMHHLACNGCCMNCINLACRDEAHAQAEPEPFTHQPTRSFAGLRTHKPALHCLCIAGHASRRSHTFHNGLSLAAEAAEGAHLPHDSNLAGVAAGRILDHKLEVARDDRTHLPQVPNHLLPAQGRRATLPCVDRRTAQMRSAPCIHPRMHAMLICCCPRCAVPSPALKGILVNHICAQTER